MHDEIDIKTKVSHDIFTIRFYLSSFKYDDNVVLIKFISDNTKNNFKLVVFQRSININMIVKMSHNKSDIC
jgi:hypothetical protein